MSQVHILNGDSLKIQLQGVVNYEVIVARECLIDGNVQGETLTEFYANRAKFIAQYDDFTVAEYYERTAMEIDKIVNLKVGSEVVCWFEDDLFCQVNFWFIVHLLIKCGHQKNIALVRPNTGNEYSFAAMTNSELQTALKNKKILCLDQLQKLKQLWPLYQQNNCNKMLTIAKELGDDLPFLLPAIKAHQRRLPDESGLGYPEKQLLAVIKELNTQEFSTVFKCFSAREGIYSFGDIQVKQMYDRLRKNKNF